jgi:transaldolase
MQNIDNLKIKIFSDGADKSDMIKMNEQTFIQGLTTNPTLMKKAGIKNYAEFCKDIVKYVKTKPISFEVFSDDFLEMERQAKEISTWGDNVYVKIPITNTKNQSSCDLVRNLSNLGVKVNITAIMSIDQVKDILKVLNPEIPSYISIFAGRIADTGRDPLPLMVEALNLMQSNPKSELIWASPRELLNIFQAEHIGCHVITVTKDILNKLKFVGYDLNQYSLDTVKMFYNDSVEAGFKL